jgi:hypothetical protein
MPPVDKTESYRGRSTVPSRIRAERPALLRAVAIGAAGLAGAWLLYFIAITLSTPEPIEYREGASQVVTQLLLAGRNPFAPANQPLGMTNYGIVYSLVVWPFAAVFGNTLLLHRLVTAMFLILCAYLIGRTARAAGQSILPSLVGAMLAGAALMAQGGLGGQPASMGTFFFLAALALPYIRGFDRQSLLLSAAASLLALYTKPYFVLGFGIVASYLFLFVSKKEGVLYALGFGAAACVTVLVVRAVLPLYFFDTVFSNLAQTSGSDPRHVYAQLRQLTIEFLPAVVAGLLLLLAGTASQPGGGREGLGREGGLIARRLDYFGYASVCAWLAFVFILGPHPMNYMTYAYQLLVPVGILWLLVSLRHAHALASVVMPLLLINLILFCAFRLGPSRLQQSPESAAAWNVLHDFANRCAQPLSSPTVVPEMVRRGLWPTDSGHTEYFFYQQPYPGMAWFGASYELVAELASHYVTDMRASVAHAEFDCVMLARYSAWPRDLPLDRGHYHMADSVVIAMPQTDQTWQMDIWVPAPR